LCRRLTVLAPGNEILSEDLPAIVSGAADPVSADWLSALALWADQRVASCGLPLLDEATPAFERTLIRIALKHTRGHRQSAAKLLGWGRNTLARKLKELQLEQEFGLEAGAEIE